MKISKLTHRAFSLLFTLALTVPAAFGQLAVRGETIWTMTGEPITNGVVLIRDGKIERVGTAAQVQVPAGYRTITAKVASSACGRYRSAEPCDRGTVIRIGRAACREHRAASIWTGCPRTIGVYAEAQHPSSSRLGGRAGGNPRF